ncbi:creatininase family protein [Methyloversatilis thermotolerans]|uniref:creatininase family protein n=1 Tax=Methyloversatilis thermotolerans TaxID=1346290 RepID=UPI000380DCAA|nr:creatininase family protein [Methyloversatilis thermotolerans]
MNPPAFLNWQHCTPRDIRALAARDAVAVLPLGAIEQHGEHLPLSTDLDIASGLSEAALQAIADPARAVLLPAMAVALSTEHADFAGTLTLQPDTALATLVQVGLSVARAGLRRLVMVNAHGGNKSVVDLAALELRARARMLAVRAHTFRLPPPDDAIAGEELRCGLHGGALETSLMLHFAPERVRRDAIDHFEALPERAAREGSLLAPEGVAAFGWMAQDLHPLGVAGNARLADADTGRRLAGHFAAQLARIIDEAAGFDMSRLRDRAPLDPP